MAAPQAATERSRSAGSNTPGTSPASCPSSPPAPSAIPAHSHPRRAHPGSPRQTIARHAVSPYTHSPSGALYSTHPGRCSAAGRAHARAAGTAPPSPIACSQSNTRRCGERNST